MGSRGPVRDPDSRRGRREAQQADAPPMVAEEIVFPSDDEQTVEELFHKIAADLVAANIPVRQKDAYAIKCVAQNILSLRRAEQRQDAPDLEAKVALRYAALCASLTKDIMKDLAALGATPVATMRLIKTPQKVDGNSAVDDLIAS